MTRARVCGSRLGVPQGPRGVGGHGGALQRTGEGGPSQRGRADPTALVGQRPHVGSGLHPGSSMLRLSPGQSPGTIFFF